MPVERGFAFITDTANWPTFWPGYIRLEEGSSWERRVTPRGSCGRGGVGDVILRARDSDVEIATFPTVQAAVDALSG